MLIELSLRCAYNTSCSMALEVKGSSDKAPPSHSGSHGEDFDKVKRSFVDAGALRCPSSALRFIVKFRPSVRGRIFAEAGESP